MSENMANILSAAVYMVGCWVMPGLHPAHHGAMALLVWALSYPGPAWRERLRVLTSVAIFNVTTCRV